MPALRHAVRCDANSRRSEHIPYRAHVAADRRQNPEFGDYLQVFRLGGASFECSDDVQLNNWHERLNVLWRNIASPNVAVWTQTIRRRYRPAALPSSVRPAASEPPAFAAQLDAKYRARSAARRSCSTRSISRSCIARARDSRPA
jgi:type IV secretion system protein VirB4